MSKYPVYIVSKGRYENTQTVNMFIKDGVDFKILIEPQELDLYKQTVPEKYILTLPFSNLGQGSYPARNFAWEHSSKLGAKRHWVFDDNIRKARRINKGKKIPINSGLAIKMVEDFTDRYLNVGISSFNYSYFVVPGSSDKKPFYINVHGYSCMLIKNDVPYRWRMKYNEDVDLCLQFLDDKYCTLLFNAVNMDKTSTTAKMKGGNQDELYKNNSYEKKVLKTRSLEEVWPQYVKTIMRFNRPHHSVNWKQHFKHPLIRDPKFDWDSLQKIDNYNMKLRSVK